MQISDALLLNWFPMIADIKATAIDRTCDKFDFLGVFQRTKNELIWFAIGFGIVQMAIDIRAKITNTRIRIEPEFTRTKCLERIAISTMEHVLAAFWIWHEGVGG